MKAEQLAIYIVEYCKDKKHKPNTISLQKMLYLINAKYMVYVKKPTPIISDMFVKYKFGPVVEKVYRAFSFYGPLDITSIPVEYFYVETEEILNEIARKDLPINVLNDWIDHYITWDRYDLVQLTHSHNAWLKDKDKIESGNLSIPYKNDEIFEEALDDYQKFFGVN